MSKLGFIGLGIVGKPMAAHLIAAGHQVFLNSRSQVPAELTAAGGVACACAQEVAQQADIIFLMLLDTPDVARVLFDAQGVAAGLRLPGRTGVRWRGGGQSRHLTIMVGRAQAAV